MMNPNMQGEVAQEVNDRLVRATRELQEKYARGEGGRDQSVDGPSGAAYKEKHAREIAAKKERARLANESGKFEEEDDLFASDDKAEEEALQEGDDENEDESLRDIRAARLKQLKAAQRERLENVSKGHGQLREIAQDGFLTEVTGSVHVVCHFYHRDFPRCEIMNHHLRIIAAKHVETKFIIIDADKAPFFVEKLRIRTIPTVIVFLDGVATDKIIGFEGLMEGQPEGKEDEWPTIRLARLLGAKGGIDKKLIVDEEEEEEKAKTAISSMRQAMLSDLDDLDFDD